MEPLLLPDPWIQLNSECIIVLSRNLYIIELLPQSSSLLTFLQKLNLDFHFLFQRFRNESTGCLKTLLKMRCYFLTLKMAFVKTKNRHLFWLTGQKDGDFLDTLKSMDGCEDYLDQVAWSSIYKKDARDYQMVYSNWLVDFTLVLFLMGLI